MASVLRQYRERVDAGILTNDPVQAEAAERLDDLARRLADPPKGGWFSKYKDDAVFQEYLRRMRARPAYVRAREIQAASPWLD